MRGMTAAPEPRGLYLNSMGKASGSALAVVGVALASAILLACGGGPAATYIPHDATLRALPLSFYPSSQRARPASAFVFFFGNDVGFWKPHRELAAALASDGYSVVGIDIRPVLASLPDREPARDSAFAARIMSIIVASRHELSADSVPLILAGHSLGAEIAIWTAAHVDIGRVTGVLAMSPRSRSHLRATLNDIANRGEPTDAESFDVGDAVRALPAPVRLAIVRGEHDKYATADSALISAGGARADRYVVPLAGHSLRNILIAGYVVSRALGWILQPLAARR